MTMRKAAVFASLLILTSFCSAGKETIARDYVPNEETAVAVAEAVLIPIYGRKTIEAEKPFHATLKNEVWQVAGTLYCANGKPQSDLNPTCVGGVAVIEISKRDAHIISVVHYK